MLGHRPLELDDLLAILKRRRYWVFIPAVLGPILALLMASFLPKQYTSKTLVLVEDPRVPVDIVKPIMSDSLNRRLSTMQEQILSRTRLIPVIERFGLFKLDAGRVPAEDLVARLRKSITVEPVQPMASSDARGIQGFTISFTGDNPQLAQQVCAEITSMFIGENLKSREQAAVGTTEFLASQLAESKRVLDGKDATLAEFKRRYMGQLPEQEKGNLEILMSLRNTLAATTEALSRARQDKSFTDSMLSQQLTAWRATQEGKSPASLEEDLAKAQGELTDLQARYTPDHPDVIKKQREILQLKKRINEGNATAVPAPEASQPVKGTEPPAIQQLRTLLHQHDLTIAAKTKEQENVQEQIRIYQARIQSSPMVEQQYKDLTRDYNTALEFYNDLLKKMSQSEMATDLERRQQGEQFRVLDPPGLPEKPSFPKLHLFGMGGLGGGLALGLGIAFLLELTDKSLRSERDVEFLLQTQALAVIPYIAPQNGQGRRKLVPQHPNGDAIIREPLN